MNNKKDQDMSSDELYTAYDLSENQLRKFLVKVAKGELENVKDKKSLEILTKGLEVVERYIKGQSTKKELEEARNLAKGIRYRGNEFVCVAFAVAAKEIILSPEANWRFIVKANSWVQFESKKFLLEVINEMDEFEREIRRKI